MIACSRGGQETHFRMHLWRARSVVLGLLLAGCSSDPKPTGVTPENHRWFPISTGSTHQVGKTLFAADGPLACESCHLPSQESFQRFSCEGCHKHQKVLDDRLHSSVSGYLASGAYPGDAGFLLDGGADPAALPSQACLGCHPTGAPVPYDHVGINGGCGACHDVAAPFAALPLAGFTHPSMGTSDCGGCHVTSSWKGASDAPPVASDPANDLQLVAQAPAFVGTTIASLSPRPQSLPMPMNHTSSALSAAALSGCGNCHLDAASGVYFPGSLHSSLANLKLPQPTACKDCHASTMPAGFVGPVDNKRSPASGPMRHEAVAWDGGSPTAAAVVSFDCSVCHTPPSEAVASSWGSDPQLSGPARFHASLQAAGKNPGTSCLDCHANSRPARSFAADAGLPAKVQFDHRSVDALGDCGACHAASASTWAAWSGGKFHAAGAPVPNTCGACHEAERPTSTAGWAAGYTASPFDYTPNSSGIGHGAGLDCAACHAGSVLTQTWAGGKFTHGTMTLSGTTCISCHTTQRPDLQPGANAAAIAALLGIDHATSGTGDCFACHQATATAGRYVDYRNPADGGVMGGDWKGGQTYPGSVPVSAPNKFITVGETFLNRPAPGNRVASTSTSTATLYNSMLHISAALRPELQAGPASAPDNSKCWHCHAHVPGSITVSGYANGTYHASYAAYAPTPDAGVTPLTDNSPICTDCHVQMKPSGIVLDGGSTLAPMDHAATFSGTVTIGGKQVTSVGAAECSACHGNRGVSWSGGKFHSNVSGSGTPSDCLGCHYPLLADAAKSDVASGSTYTMKHRSGQVTSQTCATCHPMALGKAAMAPSTAALWKTGTLHAGLGATQPSACLDCHSGSLPAGARTSSTVYPLVQGATASNKAQWMNHAAGTVVGKDCAVCHQADATAAPSGWSPTRLFHANVTAVTTCRECHGLTNGGGATPGTNNNLPAGLNDSATVSTAAGVAGTGIPAGTKDQISHADVNVTGRECNACHTQVGPASPTTGKEWANAKFHSSFSAATPLVINGTTGRCSNCHLNVKPGTGFTPDHSGFTAVSGSTDCSSCHSLPGTGSAASPNWLGAVGGMPAFITVGGFTIPAPPAAAATTQSGISNLPHPTPAAGVQCTACHTGGAGGKNAIGYDHKSTLINANCNSCHMTGSNLIGTPWNGATTFAAGTGDTLPFTLTSVTPSFKGNNKPVSYAKHFYPTNCYQCHKAPAGNGLYAPGTTYTAAWKFVHTESHMTNPTTCNMCHQGTGIPK